MHDKNEIKKVEDLIKFSKSQSIFDFIEKNEIKLKKVIISENMKLRIMKTSLNNKGKFIMNSCFNKDGSKTIFSRYYLFLEKTGQFFELTFPKKLFK